MVELNILGSLNSIAQTKSKKTRNYCWLKNGPYASSLVKVNHLGKLSSRLEIQSISFDWIAV